MVKPLTVSGRLPAGENRSIVMLTTVGNVQDGTLVTNEATLTVQGEGGDGAHVAEPSSWLKVEFWSHRA